MLMFQNVANRFWGGMLLKIGKAIVKLANKYCLPVEDEEEVEKQGRGCTVAQNNEEEKLALLDIFNMGLYC